MCRKMILNISRASIKVALAGRTITVPGEMFFSTGKHIGFVIFPSKIAHWDCPDQDRQLTELEIVDVVAEIRADFERGGHTLEIE